MFLMLDDVVMFSCPGAALSLSDNNNGLFDASIRGRPVRAGLRPDDQLCGGNNVGRRRSNT